MFSTINAEENEVFVEKNEFKNVGVSDSIISCNGTTVTSSVSLNMPGAENYFLIEVENTGSIPFKLKSIQDLDTNDIYTVEEITAGGAIYKEHSENTSITTMFAFDDLMDDPSASENGYVTNKIIPGGKAVFYLHNFWQKTDDTQLTEALTLKTNLKLNFEQVTSE